MYTRCPSCRSEISFEAPSNLANLPDGYKHRIKCPNCGVTIGVKIPRQDSYLEAQPVYRPQNANATSFEPIYQAGEATSYVPTSDNFNGKIKPLRKSGRPRSAFMLIFSLIFVALGIIGYLIKEAIIPIGETAWLNSFLMFDGITAWKVMCTEFEAFKMLIGADALFGFLQLVPMLLFTLSAIHLIISFSCLIAGKYSKLYNAIAGILIGGLAILMLFLYPLLQVTALEEAMTMEILMEFIMDVVERQFYLYFVSAGIGIIALFFTLGFTIAPMKKKNKALRA